MSVLFPCFDAAGTLAEALESLFRQSFSDFEIVAVDDGSTDETPELLASAARDDPRLRVFRNKHEGIAAALETAAAQARAPLLARMDADDRSHTDRLKQQIEYLSARPKLALVSARVRLFPRSELKAGYLRYERWINGVVTSEQIRKELFVESPIPHPTVVMRREAFDAVGGYRDNGWPEDYDLWMRLSFAGYRMEKLPEVLLEWRDTPERASRVEVTFSPERFLDLKEHYLLKHVLDGARPLAIWGAGPVGKGWARRLSPCCFIEVDPRKFGQRIHGAEVVSSTRLDEVKGSYVLVAVGARGRERPEARDEIRERLFDAGFEELQDFICVA